MPPSGHVAGVVAGTDLEVGVHQAPANRRIEWAVDASVSVGDEQHGILNAAGINALRTSAGRGLRVQGARTVSSDPDWRFVNVRRLISMIEKALEIALQWAVFEPNGVLTPGPGHDVGHDLPARPARGAGCSPGATPEESFFVQVRPRQQPRRGARPRTAHRSRSSVAPSKPFEFVVLRVGRVRDALEVTDARHVRREPGRGRLMALVGPFQSLTGSGWIHRSTTTSSS